MNISFRRISWALSLTPTIVSLALIGCAQQNASTLPKVELITPIVMTSMQCPITGEDVTELDEVAFFECYPVRCKGRENARQFAALPMNQRAKLATDQVLPQKGIDESRGNSTCPITGETLTASAVPVVYEQVVIGFASTADANQFRSLKAEKKALLIAQWKADEAE